MAKDLSNIKTIYNKKVITVNLKIIQSIVASNDLEIETISSSTDVYEILKAIYATLEDDQEHVILLIFNAVSTPI